jgi:2-keto-4-pentenoate hydratase
LSAGVAVILSRSLSTAGLSSAVLLDAVSTVVGAVEVVGSDGATIAIVAGGRTRRVGELDLALTGLVLELNGTQVATAAGAAAAGHPAKAAAAGLGSVEDTLAPGTTIFTGRWTAPVEVRSGEHLQASFGHLGGISVRVP